MIKGLIINLIILAILLLYHIINVDKFIYAWNLANLKDIEGNLIIALLKLISMILIRVLSYVYGMSVIITNCSNNYGCSHFSEKLIPLIIVKLQKD